MHEPIDNIKATGNNLNCRFLRAQLKYALISERYHITRIWRVHSDINISRGSAAKHLR